MQRYFQNTDQKKIIGIVITIDKSTGEIQGKKYCFVDNTDQGIRSFKKQMAKKFPDATHINFYARGSKLGQEIIN
jgi:hypothetical protein